MNSSAINSTLPFNYSSSGSSLQQWGMHTHCKHPDYYFKLQFAFYAINYVIGSPANIMVLWLVASGKIDSSTTDVFFVSLAIIDAYFSLIIPFDHFIYGYFSEIQTYLVTFSFGMKDASTLFLTCICLDRYMAVVHPIVFTSVKDNKIRVAISMLVWSFVMGFGFMRTFYYTGFLFTALILFISIIMVFCNISIMRSLRKSVLGKEKISPMKKKAQRMVQSTLAIIVFFYLPLAVASPFDFITDFETTCFVKSVTNTFMDLSCSIEPLLFISKLKQPPCLNNLPCICCRSPSPEPHNEST